MVSRLLRSSSLVARRYSGQLPGEPSQPVRLLYVGETEYARDFEIFVGNPPRAASGGDELFRGGLPSYILSSARVRREAEVADVVLTQWVPGIPFPPQAVVYHPFLDGHLPVRQDVCEQIRQVRSRAYRRLLRDVARRAEYRSTVHRDEQALPSFEAQLHQPYVRTRFGERAVLDDPAELARIYEGWGRILSVEHAGVVVAACIVLHDFVAKGVLTFHRNGIRDAATIGTRALTERTAALELALFDYAIEHRMKEIDLGFTRSIANDGRFLHKRRLGCSFSPALNSPVFALQTKSWISAALYSRFPLMTGEPHAATLHLGYDRFRPEPPTQRWRGQLKCYRLPGLCRIELHSNANVDSPEVQTRVRVLHEIFPDVELHVERVAEVPERSLDVRLAE
jgi:hypothetical protein